MKVYFNRCTNRAGLGPVFDWQEWFGGYYWLQVEFWLGVWYVGLEITNRPPYDKNSNEIL